MQTTPQAAKDPSIGAVLSLLVPGLGHLYAGNLRGFALFLLCETWLYHMDWWPILILVHVFQSVAAAGAVRLWNQERAAEAAVDIPPPPRAGVHPAARTKPAAATEPPPPPQAAAELGPDEFLDELQSAWREHRSSSITARQFADRKWRAIRAVSVEHAEDGAALVAAARELGAAGVMTSEEIGQLESRVAS